MKISRRKFIAATISTSMISCVTGAQGDWKKGFSTAEDYASQTDDTSETGDTSQEEDTFPEIIDCELTVSDSEGPYYVADAPFRNDLRSSSEDGILLELSGRVMNADCSEALEGAIIEFWQADPNGMYDNISAEMRYRCAIQTGEDGSYVLYTYLPGLYGEEEDIRPHHLHVKIWTSDGEEVLTTQLYFAGDPYLNDEFSDRERFVIEFEGSLTTSIMAEDINFIV